MSKVPRNATQGPSPTATADPDALDIEAAARRFMKRGWKVFPVKGKEPAVGSWPEDATDNPHHAEGLWGTLTNAGIGLVCGEPSGVWAVDLDGAEGKMAWQELQREYGAVPETVVSRTASGLHYLFQMPPDAEIRNSASKIADNIDVRGTRGYIVIPPSPHPSGERYKWAPGSSPEDLEPAAPPEWLVEMVTDETTSGRSSDRGAAPEVGEAIPEGRRNMTLTSLAGTMRRRGMGASEMEAALQEANRRRCSPPLPEDEVRDIAQSVARYEPEEVPVSPEETHHGGGADSVPSRIQTIEALHEELDNLEVETLVPRLAWRGFLTTLVAPGKTGKSTFAGAGACAVSKGARFLDGPTNEGEPGRVLWCRFAGEEPKMQLVERVHLFDGDTARILHFEPRPHAALSEIGEAAEVVEPDLLVIDSLQKAVEDDDLDHGDTSSWSQVLTRLTALTQHHETGTVLLHHSRREDGRYRGSSAILDGSDMLLTMAREPDPVRSVEAVGYLDVEDYEVELVDDLPMRFRLHGDSRPMTDRVLEVAEAEDGASKRRLREAIGADNRAIDAAIDNLLEDGSLKNQGIGTRSEFVPAQPEMMGDE